MAGLAAIVGATTVAGAVPASVSTTLGDLTFRYSAASWRMEPAGDALVATCVQEDCRGAVVDISRRAGETACTKETMAAEAARAFPEADRSYANVLPSGRFALVLAQRHDGPELSSPEYAYGCVAWHGSEYRFAMRPETVGTQSWIGGALHYLVANATAPDAAIREISLGDVTFQASTEMWTVSAASGENSVWLTCRMPTCNDPDISAVLSVHAPAQSCPTAPAESGLFDAAQTRIETLAAGAPDGLAFTIAETHLGCRNYVPPHVAACAIHDGRSYHLSTMPPNGCSSSAWSIPDAELRDLLRSARIAN